MNRYILLFGILFCDSYYDDRVEAFSISQLSIANEPSTKTLLLDSLNIYYHKTGSGRIPVIFVSGMAHDHSTWKDVQDNISKKTVTLSYDRAGLGKSKYHGEAKHLTALADELKKVVAVANVPEPFILVGHSMGCQIIKKFASMYPLKIKGIVFVDPGYNETKLKAIIPDSLWRRRDEMIKKYQIEFNEAQEAENKHRNKICEDADKIKEMPRVPIILYTATMVTGFPASEIEQRIKKQTHLDWLKHMPTAKHILVNTSWHYIHTDSPQTVISGIELLLGK